MIIAIPVLLIMVLKVIDNNMTLIVCAQTCPEPQHRWFTSLRLRVYMFKGPVSIGKASKTVPD